MKRTFIPFFIAMSGLVSAAHADTWNFTYTGSGYGTFQPDQFTQHNNPAFATGSISGEFVDANRVAITSGYIDITQGAQTGHFTLAGNYVLSGYNRNFFLYNNLFYPTSKPEIDYLGLLFENETNLINVGYGQYWYGRPTDYGWFIASVFKNNNQFSSSDVLGTMSFSKDPGVTVVPEPAEWTTIAFLGAGLLGLMLKKRTKTG